MAVEKMKYVNIVGHKEYLDEFIETYMSEDMGLQPEYAINVLTHVKHLYSYKGTNQASDLLRQTEELMSNLEIPVSHGAIPGDMKALGLEDLAVRFRGVQDYVNGLRAEKLTIEQSIREQEEFIERMDVISGTDVDLQELSHLKYFKVRVGRVPSENYRMLSTYSNDMDVIIIRLRSTAEYEYLIYIMPAVNEVRVDGVFNSMQFERSMIPEEFEGTPKKIIEQIQADIQQKKVAVRDITAKLEIASRDNSPLLNGIRSCLQVKSQVYEISKYVAFNKDSFYLTGWIPQSSLKKLQPKMDRDPNLVLVIDSPRDTDLKPPTKLKNFFLIRPFEMIVKMYGLPAYNELDPTPVVAIIYCLLMGIMFGDVGQGLIFLLVGAFVWFKKKSALGGVFMGGGVMAILFGFLYGSIFSYEGVIKPVFMNPMEDANVNTMLIMGIGVGVILLILCMVLNIINGIKAHDKGRILFDRNGVAGFVFYGVIIATVVSLFFGGKLWISMGLLVAALAIPFLIIFFRHPLENLINKKKPVVPGGFWVETVFEMVDMLLSFASNTISFVRISAFAINHVGLSMAVMILADMGTGIGHVIIVIIGNALILVLEGMIVGIQGLRLVYYEMFSRFYKGDGRPYEPIEGISATKNTNRIWR